MCVPIILIFHICKVWWACKQLINWFRLIYTKSLFPTFQHFYFLCHHIKKQNKQQQQQQKKQMIGLFEEFLNSNWPPTGKILLNSIPKKANYHPGTVTTIIGVLGRSHWNLELFKHLIHEKSFVLQPFYICNLNLISDFHN